MSKKAEEAALKAYPVELHIVAGPLPGCEPFETDTNCVCRKAFQQGYEQAEKDLINYIRKQVETWMPERDGDEHTEGKRLAFRSVLNLLKEMEDEK